MYSDLSLEQVMDPSASRAGAGFRMLPKFQYDGGVPSRFLRDFPLVTKFFGITEAYEWDHEKELDADQDQ